MSVLRKKMTAAPATPTLNEEEVIRSWKEAMARSVTVLEELAGNLEWKENGFTIKTVERNDLIKTLLQGGLYVGFGPTENETECLFLVDTAMAAIINKCGVEGRFDDFADLDDYALSELDLFMMEPFITEVRDSIRDMLPIEVEVAEGDTKGERLRNFGKFQKEEIDLTAFAMTNEYNIWSKLSLNFSAHLEENGPAQVLSLHIIIPQDLLEKTVSQPGTGDQAVDDFIIPENAKFLGRHIDKSVTSVRAVLDSFQMSVADCTRLEIGQVLPLPGVSLENISLEVEMRQERLSVASGLLGIHKTHRAVKLSEDISEEFKSDVIC